MFRALLLTLILSGCSTAIVPETSNQLQVVGYSQLTQLTLDVHSACSQGILTKDVCATLLTKIKQAVVLIDGGNSAMDLFNQIKEEL